MSSSDWALPFELSEVVSIAREASGLALQLAGHFQAEIKPDNTLVTQADRALEALLHEKLAALAPEFSFLGEETGLSGAPESPCWVIDPIDGTTNFVRGLPLWCISIGLVHRGRVVLGVVATPPQGELVWAATGHGAFAGRLDDASIALPLRARDPQTLIQEDLIACNTSVEEAVDFVGVPCRLRNLGSLAYHLSLLARGTLCASLAHYHKIYDVAGGVCVCIEAGCEARNFDGTLWIADVARRDATPLLVAPAGAMQVLLNRLTLREPALRRGEHSISTVTGQNE